MGLREIRSQARLALHGAAAVPVYYRATPNAAWVPLNVRVWTKFNTEGKLDLVRYSGATMEAESPRIIFLVSDLLDPPVGAVFSVAKGEAYSVGSTEVPDAGLTQIAKVKVLDVSKTSTFPVPD